MQINIIDVGTPNTHSAKNGRSYQSIEVTYKGDNGQTSSKKLMSFSNPDVFKQAQTWAKGDAININSQKDDAGYWQWIGILGAGESAPVAVQTNSASTGAKPATRVSGSNYPTSEERDKTQGFIVRQSSLSNAVNTLASGGKTASANDVIALAKVYEKFVMEGDASAQASSVEDFPDDVPF
tara:strand:+ start:3563 stop:4105 length:543 start_codon:yes stop_codon:yes gene_type:complete